LKSFVIEKRHGAMQKKKRKKERKKKIRKNRHKDIWSIENNGYKDARYEKNER
jgi:hypothetical protein